MENRSLSVVAGLIALWAMPLVAGAAEMGAIIGAAPPDHVLALRGYGADLGTAFQIIDDVLDLHHAASMLDLYPHGLRHLLRPVPDLRNVVPLPLPPMGRVAPTDVVGARAHGNVARRRGSHVAATGDRDGDLPRPLRRRPQRANVGASVWVLGL